MSSYIKDNLLPLVATEDIVCYKVVKRIPDDNDTVESWLQEFRYKTNETYSIDGQIGYSNLYSPENQDIFYRICQLCKDLRTDESLSKMRDIFVIKEGFHSYKNMERCLTYFDLNNWPSDIWHALPKIEDLLIAKCIIPEGSLYYEANETVIEAFNNEEKEIYISDSIVVSKLFEAKLKDAA